jgi:hypothetical protein
MVFLLGMDRKKRAKKIIKLPSSRPEARDEGPRLLPLDKQQQPTFRAMDHYLDLADKLLVPKPKTRQDKG